MISVFDPLHTEQALVAVPLVAFLVATVVAWALVQTRRFHIHLTGDSPNSGPQKIHQHETPRIGGLAVLAGLLGGLALLHATAGQALLAQLQTFQWVWLAAGVLPLLVLGLLEDVSSAVSVKVRLGAALAAGGLVWVLGGARITQLHVPLLDQLLLAVPAFSLGLTLLAIGGLVHAMNIIDGLNGLLAGMALMMFGAIACVSARFGEPVLMLYAAAGFAATLGFGLFNFPKGRIFCGDAGAYLIGYMLAVLLVLLVMRQPGVSPWFAMAVVIHPVTETLYSAARRILSGQSATEPDIRHLHSLWVARLRQRELDTGRTVRLGPNAGASWRTLAMAAIPVLIAVCWPGNTLVLQLVCASYVLAFLLGVRWLVAQTIASQTLKTQAGLNSSERFTA